MRRLVAFAVDRAGYSPRRASHFFLLAQKKVTQKEGPNTSPFGDHASARGERQKLWHKNSYR